MSDVLSDVFADGNEDDTVFLTVTSDEAGERADVYLSAKLGITRSAAQKLLTDGAAALADGSPLKKNARVCAGDEFAVAIPDAAPPSAEPEDIPLDVVYEDGDIIVVNKPQGMVVHPAPGHATGTLVSALLFRCGDSLSGINGVLRPGIIHRIDKDTSGLICAAKNDRAHISLSEQLKDHSMRRTYRSIVIGGLPQDSGTVDAPLDRNRTDRKKMAVVRRGEGREAITHYSVVSRLPGFTYAEMKLETGRTHQIRVHMASIGHPVLGDHVYGGGSTQFEKKHPSLFSGQCLHAAELELTHPSSGERMVFSAPLPENFQRILSLLSTE
ncbi:MAG: RluA family pseudouridine synthase [Clostridia bacterium]|nr:RluA family pseudouridine synthase [Clostridia bacterium]